MKGKIITIVILGLFSIYTTKAANNSGLSIFSLPDSLLQNANGVVREEKTDFEYKSRKSGLEKKSVSITILNKKGKDLADFKYTADKFRSLSQFSAKLYDQDGTLLKKFGFSNLQTSNWSSDLASDAKNYYFDCQSPVYPFTVQYDYEIDYRNGILSFPVFCPQDDYNLSVVKAIYSLSLPDTLSLSQKAIQMSGVPQVVTQKNKKIYTWQVENKRAIEAEQFSPGLRSIVPSLLIGPTHFTFDDYVGCNADWQSLSKWLYGLTKNRDLLNDITVSKIKELTANSKSDIEKVRILYDYLGKTTRYVSIQLGIGGLQPISAAEVCRTGFGDCKGLSNCLKAMLKVVGIESNLIYIRYSNHKETIYSDYSSTNQMNHAILQVPLANDTIWLECTNPSVPFGFIHNGIAGHDALVVKEQGGAVCRLPDYADSLNIESNHTVIALKADGSADVSTMRNYRVKMYDMHDFLTNKNYAEQAEIIRESISIPNAVVRTVKTNENKSRRPDLSVNFTWTTSLYGNKTNNRLFIPTNPYRNSNEWIREPGRNQNIDVSFGYRYIDSITIKIPAGYEIEALPPFTKLKNHFGEFESRVKLKQDEIVIFQNFFLSSGEYNATCYDDFMSMMDKVSQNYRCQMVLRKKTL